jgi:serine/threonine protein kinase
MQERELFLKALQLKDTSARRVFLGAQCQDNARLHDRVEALLDAHERNEGFLDEQALASTAIPTEQNGSEKPGSLIGPYKLLEPIGDGGFGVVYMAEQQEPIRRKVALKIIKPGMDSRQVVARFEAERQALAMMDHPNIAHVLDAGTTESGRPYFVMELVNGIPITEFCDKRSLPVEDRLRLFRDVCQAVQHAHQKGVIHRDIKPSNVMVTLRDGLPIVKVIDFGIAKAISQRLTEKTLFTRFGQIVGTPQYMSPEQAEINELDVDTRTDVYSLGVLLYELLTGQPPIDGESLHSAGFKEMLRIICERDPPTPSSRIETLGAAASTISERRSTEPKRLAALLRGELDWIVMKALEKDRNRRYETASALAADIERHLDGEPVAACPPSAAYLCKKFVQRNRGLVAAVCAVMVALAIGLIAALASREAAVAQAKTSQVLYELLDDTFRSVDPAEGRGPEYTLKEWLGDFSSRLDRLEELSPDIEANIQSTLGMAYTRLGLQYSAKPHLEKAIKCRREAFGDMDLRVADALADLAWNAVTRCQYREAKKLATEARQIYRVADQRTSIPASIEDVLSMAEDALELDDLVDIGEFSHAATSKHVKEFLSHTTFRPIGTLLVKTCLLKLDVGDHVGAELLLQEQIGKYRDSRETIWQTEEMFSTWFLGYVLQTHGRDAEARTTFRELKPYAEGFIPEENFWMCSLCAWALLHGPDPTDADLKRASDFAGKHAELMRRPGAASPIRFFAFHTLARVRAERREYDQAISDERFALKILDDHQLFLRGKGEQALAEYLTAAGNAAEAEQELVNAVKWREKQNLPENSVQWAAAEMNLAEFYLKQAKTDLAAVRINAASKRLNDTDLQPYNFYRRRLHALRSQLPNADTAATAWEAVSLMISGAH